MNYNDPYLSGDDGLLILDKWFTSDTWRKICQDASLGDENSTQFMEACSLALQSLIFHLENKTHDYRVEYEMKKFFEMIAPFGEYNDE